MDFDFRCNRLSCRKSLTDKAVVTTCSHIFCVECATELFNASRLCPACETSLTEPDDVVVSSLHPSNDYKTSVLSGLNPATVLEICSRAISFWQYQIHQENSFQHAVVRSINDKNAQLQKQFDNVVREADGEINLLSSKLSDLERDLELERRKNRDLQETSRERDKEYQKLKAQYDKLKRKALLAPGPPSVPGMSFAGPGMGMGMGASTSEPPSIGKHATGLGHAAGASVDLGAVLGGMEANGIQRTPLAARGAPQPLWSHQPQTTPHGQRQPFAPVASERSFHSGRSGSANEVEELLGGQGQSRAAPRRHAYQGGAWVGPGQQQQQQRVFAPSGAARRAPGGFRPAGKGK